MKRVSLLYSAFALFMSVSIVAGQAAACSDLVLRALESLRNNCDGLQRNTACYGFFNVDATLSDPNAVFSAPADRAELAVMQSIRTRGFDENSDEWGIAVMGVQANVPGALPGQMITMLLMGDVMVENAAEEDQMPMQAIRLTTGLTSPECETLPPATLTVQSPERLTVNISVNGAEIGIGSTGVFRNIEGDRLRLTMTDGRAELESGRRIPLGHTIEALVDENGEIIDESWGEAEIMSSDQLDSIRWLEFVPDEVMNYDPDVPTEYEVAMFAALDDDWLLVLDLHDLREVIDQLIEEGYTPDDLVDIDVDEFSLLIFDAFGEDDPDFYEQFNSQLFEQYDLLTELDAADDNEFGYEALLTDYGYDGNFSDSIFDDGAFADLFSLLPEEELENISPDAEESPIFEIGDSELGTDESTAPETDTTTDTSVEEPIFEEAPAEEPIVEEPPPEEPVIEEPPPQDPVVEEPPAQEPPPEEPVYQEPPPEEPVYEEPPPAEEPPPEEPVYEEPPPDDGGA